MERGLLHEHSTMPDFRKSEWWGLVVKVLWVALHIFLVGSLLVLDSDLRQKTLDKSWTAAPYYALLALTVAQFLRLAGSSPGYVREALDEDKSFEERAQTALNSTLLPPRGRYTNIEPLMPPPDKCEHCGKIQPFRTRHCPICNECVLKFDHHCKWLGTCVGLKNHRKYWWFLFLENLLLSWSSIQYISAMKSIGAEKNDTLLVIVIVTVLVMVLCEMYIAQLLVYHTWLVVTNQTSSEMKKRPEKLCYLQNSPLKHPFSKGFASNVQSSCCPTEAYPVYNVPTPEEIEAARGRRCCI